MSDQKSRLQTYNGLPSEAQLPLRVIALEKNWEIAEKKLIAVAQFVQVINEAVGKQFTLVQHNHQVLVKTLFDNGIINREQMDAANQLIIEEMKKKAEAMREAAEQEKVEDSDAADVEGQSGGEAGTGDNEPEGVSGTPRRHLSAVPKPDGGSGNTH